MFFDHFKLKYPDFADRFAVYAEQYRRIEVPARTVLLKEGEISKRAFHIEQGCLRVWFNKNGVDITFQFAMENQVISSAESFRKNIPSLFTIETIEPSIVYVLHKSAYEKIMAELGKDIIFLNQLMENLFDRQLYYMNEFLSFIRDTPEQRYLNLIEERPEIVKRVPQHYIASYLGISPVHLSRIRNKLLKEKK